LLNARLAKQESIKRLIEEIGSHANSEEEDTCKIMVDWKVLTEDNRCMLLWAMPYWLKVQEGLKEWKKGSAPALLAGKYHPKMRLLRWQLLIEAVKNCDDQARTSHAKNTWIGEYCKLIRDRDVVLSEARSKRLEDCKFMLEKTFARVPLRLDEVKTDDAGTEHYVTVLDEDAIHTAIDWDCDPGNSQTSVYESGTKEDPLVFPDFSEKAEGHKKYHLLKGIKKAFLCSPLLAWEEPAKPTDPSSVENAQAKSLLCKEYAARVHLSPMKTCTTQCYSIQLQGNEQFRNPSKELTVAIPDMYRKAFDFESVADAETVVRAKKQQADGQPIIWVFTASYNRQSRGLLDRKNAFKLSRQFKGVSPFFVQVLVVRKNKQNGDPEFETYKTKLGEDYVIFRLPDTFESQGKTVNVLNGIGYARLFSQLIAHELGLERIWMIDDNVKSCLTFDLASLQKSHLFTPGAQVETYDELTKKHIRHCSFADVILSIEGQVLGVYDAEHSTEYTLLSVDQKQKSESFRISTESEGLKAFPDGGRYEDAFANTTSRVETRGACSGPLLKNLAVIGMPRDAEQHDQACLR
jgi:hypothetical protein